VLSLAAKHPAMSTLINPRQSSAIHYESSPLNTMTPEEGEFRAGPAPGSPLPECPVIAGDETRHITELLPDGFVLLAYTDSESLPPGVIEEVRSATNEGLPASLLLVTRAADTQGRFRTLFDAAPSAIYLIRPDGHVCARWRTLRKRDLSHALRAALAVQHTGDVQ
jgi:3-(3-hydroxy-phenyl)propionate hydroxylase